MSLKPQLDFGDLFTIDKFMEMVKKHSVVDGDGTGYFATATELSDIVARPSTIEHGWPMKATGPFTHVMWFNK